MNAMSHSQRPLVSVIVVTFNSGAVIHECLEPFQSVADFEIVLVDNASSDETLDLASVVQAAPVRLATNIGFAKAVNIGVNTARGKYLLVLNPDARIAAETVRTLIDTLERYRDSAIAAPRLNHPDGRTEIANAGRYPTIWRMLCHYGGISRLDRVRLFEGHYLRLRSGDTRAVDWVSGACFVIRKRDWVMLGGFSERWFMYGEDLDLCFRATQVGRRVIYDPGLQAMHFIGKGSLEEFKPTRVSVLWGLNTYDFYCQSFAPNPLRKATWRIVVAAGLLSRSAAFAMRARRSTDRLESGEWRRAADQFALTARSLLRLPKWFRDSDRGSV